MVQYQIYYMINWYCTRYAKYVPNNIYIISYLSNILLIISI